MVCSTGRFFYLLDAFRKLLYTGFKNMAKIALTINPDDNIILANELTNTSIEDGDVVDELLKHTRIEMDSFTGDAVYDKNKVYDILKSKQIKTENYSTKKCTDKKAWKKE
jgi:hypothetical protein